MVTRTFSHIGSIFYAPGGTPARPISDQKSAQLVPEPGGIFPHRRVFFPQKNLRLRFFSIFFPLGNAIWPRTAPQQEDLGFGRFWPFQNFAAQIFFDFFSAAARVVGSEKLLGARFELVFSSRFWCRFVARRGAANGPWATQKCGLQWTHRNPHFFAHSMHSG